MEITDGIGLAKFGEIGKLLLIVVLVKFILYGCLTFRNGCIEKIARYQTVVAVFVGNGLDGTALFQLKRSGVPDRFFRRSSSIECIIDLRTFGIDGDGHL